MPKSHIIVDDGGALLLNPCPGVLRHLSMTVKYFHIPEIKTIDPDTGEETTRPGPKELRRKTEKLYTVLPARNGVASIQLLSGFTEEVIAITRGQGYDIHVFDRRKDFPLPRMELTRDHRFSQRELLMSGLSLNKSGLIGAPTRYGKSFLILNTVRAYPNLRILVVIPGQDLLKQTVDFLKAFIKTREIVQIGGKSRKVYQSEFGITVCSADSLHKIHESEIDLILVDEPHSMVTVGRMAEWIRFEGIRRIGFGATLHGRFDGKDKLITGLFGPVLAERTYLEAVEEGAICPLVIIFVKMALHPRACTARSRDGAYNQLFFRNKQMASLCGEICRDIIPEDQQALIFIKNEKQANLFKAKLKNDDSVIAMAKVLSTKKREEVFERMQRGEILRCLATNIYAQGVTFSDLRVMLNFEAGGNNTSAIQKPGRLAEIRPGKNYGLIVDFEFHMADDPMLGDESLYMDAPWYALVRDSKARKKAYADKGYIIEEVEDLEELRRKFYAYQ